MPKMSVSKRNLFASSPILIVAILLSLTTQSVLPASSQDIIGFRFRNARSTGKHTWPYNDL